MSNVDAEHRVTAGRRDTREWAIAILGAAIPFGVLVAMILVRTGGVFEYPLDDVYIHLAMSEQIAAGGYGVNAGEYTSAASSILYPFLLAPFAAFAWHVYVPLVIGVFALLASAVFWARLVRICLPAELGVGRAIRVLFLSVGPLLLYLPGLALLGMEHALHVMASLMLVLGLVRFADTGQISVLLPVAVVLQTALRFEGLATAGLTCAVLFLAGARRQAIGLGVLALIPVAIYSVVMIRLGLDPTPNSVNAKTFFLGTGGATIFNDIGFLARLIVTFILKMEYINAQFMAGIVLAWIIALPLLWGRFVATECLLAGTIILTGMAHLTLAGFTPVLRYEYYALTVMAGLTLYLVPRAFCASGRSSGPVMVGLLAFLALPGAHSTIVMAQVLPATAEAVFLQQRQMGRFVDDYIAAPVAINDLGHISYRNPHYVLDLWGLASRDALAARLSNEDGWTARLTEQHGTELAMIYDAWLASRVGDAWVRIAVLHTEVPHSVLGDTEVAFYATRPEAVAPLTAALRDFAPTLPPGAVLEMLVDPATAPATETR